MQAALVEPLENAPSSSAPVAPEHNAYHDIVLKDVGVASEHKADGEFMQADVAEPLEISLPSFRLASPEHNANREIVPSKPRKAIVSKSQNKKPISGLLKGLRRR